MSVFKKTKNAFGTFNISIILILILHNRTDIDNHVLTYDEFTNPNLFLDVPFAFNLANNTQIASNELIIVLIVMKEIFYFYFIFSGIKC